jgi:cellulose synthase/poly-beta-1,6-N-acetylglucosamine synthase-like glycosyltransferase
MIAETLFWAALGTMLYTYAGYPIIIMLWSLFSNNRVKTEDIEPAVTLLIAAYNEEKHIEAKLLNSFELDYPRDKLEIVVASDGSTDTTDEIVRRYENNPEGIRVVLHRVEGRLGKTAAQNSALNICQGEIVIFSDAASMYERGVIRAFVRNYADETVGAVSGTCHYTNERGSSVGRATAIFWYFENFIKKQQTRIKTITGCCGCIYSVRKKLYTPLPPEIISDLVEPLTIVRKGYRIVFEPEALALEETAGKANEEFKMRIRVIVRGMNGMLYMRNLFNPLKHTFVSFQLISHKVLRWLAPVLCIMVFLSNALLVMNSTFYLVAFGLQIVFYLMAAQGRRLENKGVHSKLFYLPLYFCVVNLASLVSMLKVLKRTNIVTWQPQR